MRTSFKVAVLVVFLFMGIQLHAQGFDPIKSIYSDKTSEISVDLNQTTVKFSHADYSYPTLKVLIPELAGITALNHRNTAEGAPCLRIDGEDPRHPQTHVEDILKEGEGTDKIAVRVLTTIIKTPRVGTNQDGESFQVCKVDLQEDVETTIRGHKFVHSREAALPDRVYEDCK